MFCPDEKLIEAIDSWIEENKETFVTDLNRIVSIPSISEKGDIKYPYGKNCGLVLDEISNIAESYGFHVENHEYHCGSCLVKGESKQAKRIGFYAHLDVVPFGEGWHYPPLACTVKNGFLIGRGVGDNKGPAICILYALRFLKEHGIRLNHDVLLYFGLNEEAGMKDIEYFCKTQQIPDVNLVTDTNFPLCYGEKGRMCVKIGRSVKGNLISFSGSSVINMIPSKAEAVVKTEDPKYAEQMLMGKEGISVIPETDGVRIIASGISKHAAFPEDSVNAVHILAAALADSGILEGEANETVRFVAQLTSDSYGNSIGIPMEDKESGKLTSVGSMASVKDQVLWIGFDVRYPVTAKEETVKKGFENKAKELGFSFEIEEMSAPAYVSLDTPYIPLLIQISDFVQKKHYEPYTMGGGTYSRHLPSAIGFGPGIPDAPNLFEHGHGQGHQPDECVPLDMLLKGLKTYIIVMMEFDKIL